MLKVTQYISVSLLVPALFALSHLLGRIKEMSILFIIVSIHEIAHIIAAAFYGHKISKVVLTPIGFLARINYSKTDFIQEFVIALSGPLVNIIMAILGYYINRYYLNYSDFMFFFILCNTSLAVLNLLPVLPLDGGRMFKVLILKFINFNSALTLFKINSVSIGIMIIIAGIYQFLNNFYNLSLLAIGIIIFIWMYKENQEVRYELIVDIINKRDSFNKDNTVNIQYVGCMEDMRIIDVIKYFYKSKYHIIKIMDASMRVIGEISETDILKSFEHSCGNTTLGQIINIKKNN